MIEADLKLLDETIQIIKSKNDNSSFSIVSLHEFELVLFICLDLTRYELQQNAKISDLNASILSKLFAFQCFEFYYRDFPEIYLQTSALFTRLIEYNEKLKNNDLQMNESIKNDWINELNLALSKYFS